MKLRPEKTPEGVKAEPSEAEERSLVTRGHVICLDLTVKQVTFLKRCAGTARKVWNWALGEWNRQYAAGEKPNARALAKQFNTIKYDLFPWLHEMPRDTHSQPFRDLGVAWSNFFNSVRGKRKGPPMSRPQFKKKGDRDAFYVANDRMKVGARGKGKKKRGKIMLPVLGWVRMTEALRWPGKIQSARIFRKAAKWYAAIAVETPAANATTTTPQTATAQKAVLEPKRPIIGVDLGLKTAVVTSDRDPARLPLVAPKPLRTALMQLARTQRQLHRRKKGSQNRYKTQMKIARIYARVANIRTNFWHQLTTRLIRENQAIVIEDLGMLFMLKNQKLSFAASDVALGMFRPMLAYKAEMAGVMIFVADRQFPSTQRCACCGHIKNNNGPGDEKLTLNDREYRCNQEFCGVIEDRDVNAALNLEQYPGLEGNWRDDSCEAAGPQTSTETGASAQRSRKGASSKRGRKWKLRREDSHERTT